MNRWLATILLFFSTAVNAGWQDWTSEQRQWYIASNVLLLADWSTTRDMTRRYDEGYRELNPILGSRPSTDKLDLYFITYLIGHYFLTDYLQGRNREIYLYTITGVEGAAVANNLNIGLRLRF
jgi:hypothetical protein